MKNQIPINKLKSVTSSMAGRRSAMPVLLLACVALLWVAFAAATAQAQTLLSETTWGGNGSDVSDGVAIAVRRRLVRRGHHRQLHHGSIRQPQPENFSREIRGGWIARLAENLERDHRQGAWANRRRARRR